MRIFGLEITKAAPLSPIRPSGVGGWVPYIREAFAGAWQRNITYTNDSVLSHHAVYGCLTLISNDVGKLRPKVVQKDASGIWSEVQGNNDFTRLLARPNRYQNHVQFKEHWILSKLTRGNTYALKERDRDGKVTALYILDPARVQVLVSSEGDVFYQLSPDNLSGLEGGEPTVVPASEVIHDRMNCLFHPLVGVSPIFACGMAAHIGNTIQNNSAGFFGNGSMPSGILTAPGTIPPETAKRLKDHWDNNYTGENAGKVAVLGDGLKFEGMRMTAVDAQMIEHLKWTAETVCSTFHVPPFKLSIGQMPTYQNGEILNQIYYSDCLQSLIEQFELCMDEGLGLMQFGTMGVELDLDDLLRMDTATQIKALSDGIAGALYTPNEARRKLDLKPLVGGDTVYLQVQNYSLEALNRRDTTEPPPVSPSPAPPPEKEFHFHLPPGRDPESKGWDDDMDDEGIEEYAGQCARAELATWPVYEDL